MGKKEETNNEVERKEGNDEEKENRKEEHELPLMALNHVSRLCRSVKDSVDFYTKALGYRMIVISFDFFSVVKCEDMEAMEQKFKESNIKYMKRTVEDEKGTTIDQLFFKDPDGFMIEICNCENLKLVPAGSFGRIKLPFDRHNPPVDLGSGDYENLAQSN
ncbi:hypothetical protein F0562_018769 [Nyssa sinensis]|uniref:VOC domain-containing protein n=1 Tax=Nyssa sinensis TaxID=561372 RepID=A0A5J4ZB39_9ASTE|nr:hypothetical protein F0562_018769 [Nyssa sinensis]